MLTTRLRSILVPFLCLAGLVTAASIGFAACGEPREATDGGEGGAASSAVDTSLAPRVRLRLSGQLEGYLEPCGCAANQLGGLARRAFALRQDPSYDVLIEGGNLLATGTELDIDKLQFILTVLSDSDSRYDAVGVGPNDLALVDGLYFQMAPGFGIPLVASDLMPRELADGTPFPLVAHHELATADEEARVRIASFVLADVPGFKRRSPEQAWEAAMQGADPETFRVLLAHGGTQETEALATLEPRPDLIVGINAIFNEPEPAPRTVEGVPIVYPGSRGRYLLDVWLTRIDGVPQITRYDDIALAASKTAPGAHMDPDVQGLLLEHRKSVRDNGIREAMANRLPRPNDASYVGSAACAGCHVSATAAWQKSRHGHAWATLEKAEGSEKYPWPVTHYPDCVQCHTVGYQQKGGFVGPDETPHLKDVGCEECHGPGSRHIANPAAPGQFVEQTIDRCVRCHSYEQTPLFEPEYDKYWKMIEHGLAGR